MRYDLCRHVRINGVQCQSPALRQAPYCFFHTRMAERHTPFRHTPETRGYLLPGHHIQLTALEDRESIQVSLSVVINALATGQLETRRATAILYGLQLASMNAAHLHLEPFAPDVVRTAAQTPDGLELAEPGATGHIPSQQELDARNDTGEDGEEEDPDEEGAGAPQDADTSAGEQQESSQEASGLAASEFPSA